MPLLDGTLGCPCIGGPKARGHPSRGASRDRLARRSDEPGERGRPDQGFEASGRDRTGRPARTLRACGRTLDICPGTGRWPVGGAGEPELGTHFAIRGRVSWTVGLVGFRDRDGVSGDSFSAHPAGRCENRDAGHREVGSKPTTRRSMDCQSYLGIGPESDMWSKPRKVRSPLANRPPPMVYSWDLSDPNEMNAARRERRSHGSSSVGFSLTPTELVIRWGDAPGLRGTRPFSPRLDR